MKTDITKSLSETTDGKTIPTSESFASQINLMNDSPKYNETKNLPEQKNLTQSSRNSIYHKCQTCNKKVMLHGKCKCSNYYCPNHLHQHECSFSYFAQNKLNLEKKNLKVETDKLVRI